MNLNYHIHATSIKCPYCDKNCFDDDAELSKCKDGKEWATKVWNTRKYNDYPPCHDVEEYYKD